MTPRQFVAILKRASIDADLKTMDTSYPLPTGKLPNGQGWILADEADAGFVQPNEEMPPRLHLQFYKPASEEFPDFTEPTDIYADITSLEAAFYIVRKAANRRGIIYEFLFNRYNGAVTVTDEMVSAVMEELS
jgi:hypothetical protein